MTTPKIAIGIDIGGTKMAAASVDQEGNLLDRLVLPTEAELGFPRAVDRLGAAIATLLERARRRAAGFTGIGIGCAGPVDPVCGLINNPYTLSGWNQCDIVTPLRRRFGVPVLLENDADAAAMGECFVGAGRGGTPVVMLTFGTGIGGGAVLEGRIHRGANGEHPEFGHLLVEASGPECYCGAHGCLESLASGTAIGAAGREFGCPDARAVFAAAASGNARAQAIIGRAKSAAATAAWTICHTLLPRCLVLGGGIMEEHFELFAEVMHARLATATQFTHSSVSIVKARLGNDAGLVGAALLAFGASGLGAT
jgi:glucokinase